MNRVPTPRSSVIALPVVGDDRILLLEPEAGARTARCRMLRKLGFAVDAVARTNQVLDCIEKHRPDLILLRLGGGQGWSADCFADFCGHPEIRDIPIVILSDVLETSAIVAALDQGARDVWSDSLSAEELAARIRSQLRMAAEFHRLREQVSIDDLTGILNRRGVLDVLERETNRLDRHGRPLGILLIDVDAFKYINDTYGHMTGDEVLRDIARVLGHSIRSSDAAGRIGGDEFLVILPEVTPEQAQQVADRIRDRIGEISISQSGVRVSASIGVAVTESQIRSSHGLLVDADQSMYRAKRGVPKSRAKA